MLPGEQYAVKGVTIDGLKTGTSDSAELVLQVQVSIKDIALLLLSYIQRSNKDNRFKATQDLYKILKTEDHLQK